MAENIKKRRIPMTKISKLLYYCVNRFYFTIMVFLDAGLPNDALIELQTIMCIILQPTFFLHVADDAQLPIVDRS